jgi:glycosyltransferase involved in cell wall biosynthesis
MRKAIHLLRGADAEVIFGTQPSVHFVPGRRIFQFLYDIRQLAVVDFYYNSYDFSKGGFRDPYYRLLRIYRNAVIEKPPRRWFIALSRSILSNLKNMGYENSSIILPPSRNSFRPMPKKKQVIMVARVVPEKRLETFLLVAESLPQYPFVIVGRESPDHPGYKDRLLRNAPWNLHYVEAPLNERPELLQESKVYLHTGRERGLGIAIAEGISAGCFPICYAGGDGAELVRESGIGRIFDTVEAAVGQVKEALEDDRIRPEVISERAKEFGPEVFEGRIKTTVEKLS